MIDYPNPQILESRRSDWRRDRKTAVVLAFVALGLFVSTRYHSARLAIAEERAGEARMLAAQAHERIDWLRGRLAEIEAEARP